MAKFLTTSGNSYFIEQIIVESSQTLTIVTPYLKLSKILFQRLADAEREGVKITFIYGKTELVAAEKKKLYSFSNIEIYFCENLHAKCYHNEKSMVITSMNLYEFSEKNNREMGLFIDKNIDSEIFADALKEIESIKNSSVLEKKIENGDNNSTENEIRLHPDFNEVYDFYLPSLRDRLIKNYPEYTFVLDEELYAEGFPLEGVTLIVRGTVNFLFANEVAYNRFESRKKINVERNFPGIRFYWNRKKLNIYPEKKLTINVNIEDLKMMVEKYLPIIETVYQEMQS